MTCWELVSEDWTCIEPAGGPHADAAVLASIRDFDQTVRPLWRRQLYLGDGRPVVSVVFGLGRHVTGLRRVAPAAVRVKMPLGATEPAPNVVELWWRILNKWDGGPDFPLRVDSALWRYCRMAYNLTRPGAELALEQVRSDERARLAKAASYKRELRARHVSLENNLRTVLDGRTLRELQDWSAAARARRAPAMVLLGRRYA